MEFIILGGLALFGYEISRNGKVHDEKKLDLKDDKINVKSHVSKQHNSGTPFFSSIRKQNTNDNVKQRRFEMFAGAESVDYKPKREVAPIFSPEETKTDIRSFQVQSDSDRLQRYIPSTTMNNVLPFEQQKVGPGLHTDDNTTGGFHQYFRILPNNVNEYKKNNFEGRVIAGKGVTMDRQSTENVESRRPERFYDDSKRPQLAGKYMSNAPAVQSNTILKCTDRGDNTEYFGTATSANVLNTKQSQETTRLNDKTTEGRQGHAFGSDMVTGAYTSNKYLVHDTDRENSGVTINGQSQNSGQTVNTFEPTSKTHRQTTEQNNFKGTVKYHVDATTDYSTAFNASKLGDRKTMEYTPGAGNMNVRQNPSDIIQNNLQRNDDNENRLEHSKKIGLQNFSNVQQIGAVEHMPKLAVANTRATELNFASEQLIDNPFHQKIY